MAGKTIAAVFGSKGGMSDVGKFVAQLALENADVTVRIIQLALEKQEGNEYSLDVDVTDKQVVDQMKAALTGKPITKIDIGHEDATQKLKTAIKGSDAVVACLGNRQPFWPRWLGLGTEKLVSAMEECGTQRLVILSSMGIGRDFLPFSFIRHIIWAGLLRTLLRSGHADLYKLERAVTGSKLDYLLVRAAGLTPEESPGQNWKVVSGQNQGGLILSMAKKDYAAFMLKEAIDPEFRKTAISIGRAP